MYPPKLRGYKDVISWTLLDIGQSGNLDIAENSQSVVYDWAIKALVKFGKVYKLLSIVKVNFVVV